MAYAEAARSLGLDPYHMARRAGLPTTVLDERDHKVLVDRVHALLVDTARAAKCEEFGLLVGGAFKISMKGALGLLIREQPDARRALDALRRYLRYQNDNVEIRVEPEGDGVLVIPTLLSDATRSSRLMIELSVAMYVEMFRALLGPTWSPSEVRFAHASPVDVRPYQRQLGNVRFAAKVNGFVLTGQDLATPLPQSDAGLASEIARFIEATGDPRASSVVEEVAVLIHRLLPQGECGVDEVARQMGVDRRTIHRRLAAEHASFTQLLEEVRRRMAADLLEHGDQPLGEITHQLGFSSLSAFSRWFHNAFGIQPREFRRLSHAS